jgi:hypothetical protein
MKYKSLITSLIFLSLFVLVISPAGAAVSKPIYATIQCLLISSNLVYTLTSSMFIQIDPTTGNVGTVIGPGNLYYTTPDCTGTPYVYGASLMGYLLNVGNQHMKIDTSTPAKTLTILSSPSASNPSGQINGRSGAQYNNLYTLIPATSPFQEPVPFPLQVKYQ